MQEKAQLLEAQVADVTAQLHAVQERNAALQQQMSSQRQEREQADSTEPQSMVEMHATCKVLLTLPVNSTFLAQCAGPAAGTP